MDARCIIREMNIGDYAEIINLWRSSEGVGLSDADTHENISLFLTRNIGLSFVAEMEGKVIGTILCGHDGRRGYIYHLAVNTIYRRKGVGRALVAKGCAQFRDIGIRKCHLFVFADNKQGQDFWNHIGFRKRDDVQICSKDI